MSWSSPKKKFPFVNNCEIENICWGAQCILKLLLFKEDIKKLEDLYYGYKNHLIMMIYISYFKVSILFGGNS